MSVILDRLTPIRLRLQMSSTTIAAPPDANQEQIESHIGRRMEDIPEKSITESAARMGITVDQMRERLRDGFRKGLQ